MRLTSIIIGGANLINSPSIRALLFLFISTKKSSLRCHAKLKVNSLLCINATENNSLYSRSEQTNKQCRRKSKTNIMYLGINDP